MSLRKDQALFSWLVANLILEAYRRGYEITLGEAWRSPQEADRQGFSNSNHTRRLAIDLNLFKDGAYLQSTEEHLPLGLWWESIHPRTRWGGRFGDGNHYSIDYNGTR